MPGVHPTDNPSNVKSYVDVNAATTPIPLYHYVMRDNSVKNGVALYDGNGVPLGVNYGPIKAGSEAVNIRLCGGGGTYIITAGGAIADGAVVTAAATGRVTARAAETTSQGVKDSEGTSADGDQIEVVDNPQEGL